MNIKIREGDIDHEDKEDTEEVTEEIKEETKEEDIEVVTEEDLEAVKVNFKEKKEMTMIKTTKKRVIDD